MPSIVVSVICGVLPWSQHFKNRNTLYLYLLEKRIRAYLNNAEFRLFAVGVQGFKLTTLIPIAFNLCIHRLAHQHLCEK